VGVSSAHGYVAADHLPQFLTDAVREVGDALGLGPSWLNSGPAGLVRFGLPKGIEKRVTVRIYGGLEVHLPAIEDLICFKLYAAVDLTERASISKTSSRSNQRATNCCPQHGGLVHTIRRSGSEAN
jgi:hypothetical protein